MFDNDHTEYSFTVGWLLAADAIYCPYRNTCQYLMASYEIRSPASEAPSPRPKFDTELLKAYIKKLLSTTLQGASYPSPRERDRTKAWCKEIGERVKERMLGVHYNFASSLQRAPYLINTEIQPRGL